MKLLNPNIDMDNKNLQELTVFVENTKDGNYTVHFDKFEIDLCKRIEEPNEIEKILSFIDNQQIYFLGMSY